MVSLLVIFSLTTNSFLKSVLAASTETSYDVINGTVILVEQVDCVGTVDEGASAAFTLKVKSFSTCWLS